MFAGVDWRAHGKDWVKGMQDPETLFAMPFLRWVGLHCEPKGAGGEIEFNIKTRADWIRMRNVLRAKKGKPPLPEAN